MATTTIGKLNFVVSADSSGVAVGLRPGSQAISKFAKESQSAGGSATSGLIGGFTAGGLAAGAMMAGVQQAVAGVQQFTSTVTSMGQAAIASAANFEDLGISFRVMLGSASEATTLLSDLRQFANTTPLSMSGLSHGAQTLLQYGVAGEEVLGILKMLGDVSGGNDERLSRLTLAFGQMSAAGKLMGQDLLQMIQVGFNPLKTIADATGVSYGELRKQMEDGGISTQMVTDAFALATGEGGQFFGMLEEKGDSVNGKLSTLKDAATNFAAQFGKILEPATKAFLDLAIEGFALLAEVLDANKKPLEDIVHALAEGAKAMAVFLKWMNPNSGKDSPLKEVKEDAEIVRNRLKEMATSSVSIKIQAEIDKAALKDALADVRAEIKETEQMHNRILGNLRSQRSNAFTSAADRFSTSGQQSIFGSALERTIQEASRKEIDAFNAKMEALRAQEAATTAAIKEEKVTVREARI